MPVVRTVWLVAMVTFVTVCHGNDNVYQNYLAAMRENSIFNKKISNAVSPLSWRCEVDEIGAADYECDEWAFDDDEFYIVHEGGCRVIRDDQTLQMSIQDTMICLYGKWTSTHTAKETLTRRRRGILGDFFCGVFDLGCDKEVVIVIKKPPRFTTCRPSDLKEEYFTPSGQKSVTVTWTKPTATDDDGSIASLQQVFGTTNGGAFEGSSDTWGKQHTIIYEAKDNDGMIAMCYFAFKVKIATCGALPWPYNGHRDCPDGNTLGSTCTYGCHRGYELSGPAQVTCEGGTNPSWSAAPTCEEVSCGSPPSVSDGNATCVGSTYGSYCRMSCQTGFDLDGQVFTMCQHDASWFWIDPTRCIDDIAPEITCKSPQTFYADRGMTSMSVTWEEPTATDNLDPNPVVSKISGPEQGVTMDVGDSQFIAYEAIDTDDNDSPPCVIEVRVETTSCGHPLDTLVDARLRFNCSMRTYTFGDTCTLACSLNYPLEGPDVITCERNDTGTGEPDGFWSWENDTMPYCRELACAELDPPLDGSLQKATINGFPLRTMQCGNGTEIPDLGTNFGGTFICQDDGQWSPNMPAPDCTETVSRRGYQLPSEFHYYDGVCNENNTDEILENFQSIVDNLHNTMQSICPTSTSCSVANPTVICGPVSTRRRRRATGRYGLRVDVIPHHLKKRHSLKKRQTETANVSLIFEFQIVTDFDSSGMTDNQQFAYVDGIQLDGIVPAIIDNARTGDYDHPDYGILYEDAIAFADYGTSYCAPGGVPVRVTKCNLCPRGFYEVDDSCIVCPIGKYSNDSGSATCTSCPDGYSTRQDTCVSMDNCTKLCEAGSYSPDTFAPCAPCKAGYYQPLAAQASCVACSPGKSTKATGSVASSDCQYFDAYVVDTAGQPIEADIALLNEFTLSFYIKAVSGSTDMTISVGQELEVVINNDIKVVTASTTDVIGQSSPDIWVHVAVSWDTSLGLLSAFYRNNLVERHSSVFPTSSPTVQNGHLSISAATGTGVSISGLRLQGSVVDQASSASVCQTVGDDDVVGMDMFKHKTALIAPSVCDVTDECLSSPCGSHGKCMDNIGYYTCTCFGGWSGVNCDTPPDYCIKNNCTNGATCVSGTEDYTCTCQPGYSGKFCQTPPVNGNWSSWSTWTECTVTCNNGSRERTRACDSPAPGPYGQNCTGDVTETENCNTEPCPECSEIKRPFGALLQCDTDPVTGMKTCIPDCRSGYVRPPGLAKENDTYTCGQETDYKWVPKKTIPGCVAPGRTREFSLGANARYSSAVSSEDEQTVVDTVTSNIAGTACFQSATCNVTVTTSDQSRRRKRSTGSTVTITFSIPILGTSDLQLDQYVDNGTVSSGLQEIIDAIDNLESTASAINGSASSFFDVTASGVTYTVDANTLTFDHSASCDAGQIVTDGLCAECPAGSSQIGDYCSLCDKGKYQDQTGQSSCVQCPYGFTTETIGSDASTDCSVPDNTTTSTTSTTQAPPTSSTTPMSTTTLITNTTTMSTTYTSSVALTTTPSTLTPSATTSAGVTTTEAATTTSSAVPTTSSAAPTTSSAVPTTSSAVPTTSSPTTSSAVPTTSSAAPTTSSAVPTTSSAAPTSSAVPTTSSTVPTTSSAAPTTSSAVPTTSSAATTTSSAAPTTSSAAPTTMSATTSTTTSPGGTTTAAATTMSSEAPTTTSSTLTSASTLSTTPAGLNTTLAASTSSSASVTSTTAGTSTTASTTSRPKKGGKESKDKTYVYICIAVSVVAVCITVTTVAFLCLKKHLKKRARVFDSSVDLQRPHHNVYDHPPPRNPLFQDKQGPKNISFRRGDTTLTVRDLQLEVEPGSKAGGAMCDHNTPAVGHSRSFENCLYDE